jgi:hypothetical protein
MKNIEDYLHLYLGCQCEHNCWSNIEDDYEIVEGRRISLLDASMLHEELEEWCFDIKPILRPLSDMTEEEAIECAKLSEWEPHFRDVKVERTAYGDLLVKWDGMVEGGEQQNVTGDMFYCAEQFQYLLSKSFDLFNLIPEGLAIEKTKLNSGKNPEQFHDTNLTYGSCKDCEELAKEVIRVAKQRDAIKAEILELNAVNSGLRYAASELQERAKDRDNLSEHNRSLIKDLKETREQLRVAKELKKENEHWKQTNLKAVELITKLQNENKRLIELLHNSDISPDATISNL